MALRLGLCFLPGRGKLLGISHPSEPCVVAILFQAGMGERTRSLVLHLDLTCNAEALPQSWQAKKIGANCSCPRRPGIATPQWPLREQNCCCGKSGSLPPNPVQWHMGSAQEERQAAFAGRESPLLEETELGLESGELHIQGHCGKQDKSWWRAI